jgi:hypothetical protein
VKRTANVSRSGTAPSLFIVPNSTPKSIDATMKAQPGGRAFVPKRPGQEGVRAVSGQEYALNKLIAHEIPVNPEQIQAARFRGTTSGCSCLTCSRNRSHSLGKSARISLRQREQILNTPVGVLRSRRSALGFISASRSKITLPHAWNVVALRDSRSLCPGKRDNGWTILQAAGSRRGNIVLQPSSVFATNADESLAFA